MKAAAKGGPKAFDEFVIAEGQAEAGDSGHVVILLDHPIYVVKRRLSHLSPFIKRARDDDLTPNDQRMQGTLSGTFTVLKSFVLSVDYMWDRDLEVDAETHKLSELITVPITDNIKVLTTFTQEKGQKGTMSVGLNWRN